ncbi:aminopeptidase P family N-terminal domain-containing protein, partial [Mesorhizobium sp.]
MDRNPFSEAEIAGRLVRVRTALAERELDAAVFASPENVFYLTGLDHWGYFAPHLLIVPLEGKPVLVTRS